MRSSHLKQTTVVHSKKTKSGQPRTSHCLPEPTLHLSHAFIPRSRIQDNVKPCFRKCSKVKPVLVCPTEIHLHGIIFSTRAFQQDLFLNWYQVDQEFISPDFTFNVSEVSLCFVTVLQDEGVDLHYR